MNEKKTGCENWYELQNGMKSMCRDNEIVSEAIKFYLRIQIESKRQKSICICAPEVLAEKILKYAF